MNTTTLTIPITDARNKIGRLTDRLDKTKSVLLTKRGRPQAILIGIDYWNRIAKQLDLLTQKTFINKKLMPFTREFGSQEIKEWLEEDENLS